MREKPRKRTVKPGEWLHSHFINNTGVTDPGPQAFSSKTDFAAVI